MFNFTGIEASTHSQIYDEGGKVKKNQQRGALTCN